MSDILRAVYASSGSADRYVYDMLIPEGKEDDPEYTPKPFDGEAESFEV